MKYKIECDVKSGIPLEKNTVINLHNVKVEFVSKKKLLSKIIISESIPLKEDNYPFQGSDKSNRPSFVINRDIPTYKKFLEIIQIIESYLGYRYELEKINWENPKEFWEAENDEEKRKISITSWKSEPEYPPVKDPINFQLLVNLLGESKTLEKFKIPLSFFREGRIYYSNFRYIDAFRCFYLGIESMYCGGKSKTKAQIEEYKKSITLNDFISSVIKDLSQISKQHIVSIKALADSFGISDWKSDIYKLITTTRGFLSHHTIESNFYGNPFDHEKYHSISLLLMTTLSACLHFEIAMSSKIRLG